MIKFSSLSRRNARRLLLCSVLVLALALIGGTTLAYLIDRTESVVNTFEPGSVEIEIDEDFTKNVKKDIKVTNSSTSDGPVYVRVNLLCYWSKVDDEGNTTTIGANSWTLPEDLDSNLGTGWILGDDGFYYYTTSIHPGYQTSSLFGDKEIELKTEKSADRKILKLQTLDVLAQAIQAIPTDAVEDAWPVTVGTNGALSYQAASGN